MCPSKRIFISHQPAARQRRLETNGVFLQICGGRRLKCVFFSFCSGRPKSDSPTIEMGTYGGVGSTMGGLSKASSVPLGNATLMSMSSSGSKPHLLKRMGHVTSDENQVQHHSSSEDCRLTQPLLQKADSPVTTNINYIFEIGCNL